MSPKAALTAQAQMACKLAGKKGVKLSTAVRLTGSFTSFLLTA